jgi:YegS/Rv2252/BmrU family lipid kinase
MPTIKTDWYCIVNPHAGSGKTMSEWAVAEKLLTTSSVPYKTTLTNYKFHATLLAYEAGCHGYRKILAVGGDGSVHEVLNGILRYCDEKGVPPEEFTLAVIPIGSGNDWIKSLGIPHDTKAVVDRLAAGVFGRQDIVRVEAMPLERAAAPDAGGNADSPVPAVSYMANIGGVGFDSHVCERVNALKERGKRSKLIYLGALLYTMAHTRAFHTRIVADGAVVFDGEAYSVAFGNGRYSGGGMRQVPMSEIDDGVLDYMIVPKASLFRILTQIPRLYNGTVNESGLLKTGRCAVLEMTGENSIEMDGEIIGRLPLKITMTGSQICVPVG